MSALLLIAIGILIWRLACERGRRRERELVARQGRPVGIRGAVALLMCEHDDWAYWRADGELMRAPIVCGRAELARAHAVDVLDCPGLSPADAIEVIEALDDAERRYAA